MVSLACLLVTFLCTLVMSWRTVTKLMGNHDWFAQNQPERMRELAEAAGVVWLDDTGIECDGVKFWGSPITLRFHDWAFMRDPGSDIEKHWALIPENTDVLITHGPPFGILDRVQRLDGTEEQTGCPQLLKHIQRIKPKLHVFGHIHEEYGKLDRYGTEFLNTSSMDISYRIANAPVVRLL